MARGVVRVFISSVTGSHGQAYRDAARDACHRLGLEPIMMEDFGPESTPPLEVCLARVDQADAFVCIVAHRYGSRPPGARKSFMELEFERARERGIPMQPYVVDQRYPWSLQEVDEGEDRRALEAFKARLRRDHTVRSFGDLQDFRMDLVVYLGELRGSSRDDRTPDGDGPVESGEAHQPSEADDRSIPRPPEPYHVPPYTAGQPFTGRAAELAMLDEFMTSEDPLLLVEAIGGTGKSALLWEWAETRATASGRFDGRLWWSFYEGGASMDAFVLDAAAYVTGKPFKAMRRLSRLKRSEELLEALRSRPFLIMLDGLERLLRAYHRLDPSKLRDDEVDASQRSLIDPRDADLLRQLASCRPSKVLVSTRLVPVALESATGQLIPGVHHHRLSGLTDQDTLRLLARVGVFGDARRMAWFFERLENHPLLVGMVAGLVRNYRLAPGNFDRWVTDRGAGGSLRMVTLDLVQRRTHILAAAMEGLHPDHVRVLESLSVLSGAVDYATLEAINPFLPRVRGPDSLEDLLEDLEDVAPEPADEVDERGVAEPETPEEIAVAGARLDLALTDLEDRGLVWWDRRANTYDLHPVVRAYVFDQMNRGARIEAHRRVHDHFSALPPEDADRASSVDDLRRTIGIVRALVGAGRIWRAVQTYQESLSEALRRLLASHTILELLEPLLSERLIDSHRAWILNEVGIAQTGMGRLGDARKSYEGSLSLSLREASSRDITGALYNLASNGLRRGRFIIAERMFDLAQAVSGSDRSEADFSPTLLRRAWLCMTLGRLAEAEQDLSEFDRRPRPSRDYFAGDLEAHQCQLALLRGTLDHEMLDDTERGCESMGARLLLAELRRALYWKTGALEDALRQAEEVVRLAAQTDVPTYSYEGALACYLARLGRTTQAREIAERLTATMDSVHPALRPYRHVAEALWRCGDTDRTTPMAIRAYELAWADGPPYAQELELKRVRALLANMEIDEPRLPVTAPASVVLPFEAEVRKFIRRQTREPPPA